MLNRWLHAALSTAVTYDINDDLPWIDLLFKSPFPLVSVNHCYNTDWFTLIMTLKNSAKHTQAQMYTVLKQLHTGVNLK